MHSNNYGRIIRHSNGIIFLMTILLLLWTKTLMAVPACPQPVELKQPDGTRITVQLKGDEHAHWNESNDGFLITKNENNGQWLYMVNRAGKIVPSGYSVGKYNANKIGAVKPDKAQLSTKAESQKTAQLLQAPAPALVSSTGTLKNLVVLVNFSDSSITYSNQAFDDLFNMVGYTADGAVGSVKDYYHEISYNNLTVQSVIAGPVTLDYGYAYYGGNDTYGNDLRPQQMVQDALAKLQASGFDFTTVDGDGDGWVDDLTIIHAGGGEEYGGNNSSYIWSHYWSIPTVTYDGVSMSAYHTEPARRGFDNDAGSQGITRIGVICHESGHFLGLPDLYDYGYDSEGAGNFCLMAGGSWNGNSGTSPAQMSAWCKCKLGWIIPTLKSSSETTSLPQVETNPVVFKMQGPFPSTQYFLIENRQGVGFDAAMPGYYRGILIWHIDETVSNNNDQTHYKVDLEEASGTQHLELNQSSGDDSDYFRSGNATTFSDTTVPNNLSYSGQPLGLNITSVGTTGSNMSLTIAGNNQLNITGITPVSGVAGTSVNITNLAGANFASGATVQLIKSGQSNITATNVVVASSSKITCTFPLAGAATGSWDVKMTNPDQQSATLTNGFNVITEAGLSFENFETGDFSRFPWVNSGNATWTVTSQDKYSGAFSAKAGTITHTQNTSLQVTVDCTAGNITFYRKVSSEPDFDYLSFYIDGVLQDRWSGTVTWSQVSYPVSAGIRTFKWTYSKDDSVSRDSDTAWIDDISFPLLCPDCSTIIIGTGTGTWEYPMYTYYHDSRTQVIYRAGEIGKAGNISSLALDVATVPGQIMNYWTIRMKHTSLSSYGTASFESTGWTTVYQGNEPIGTTGWRTFIFTTPFAYNGTDNLMVDFSHNDSSWAASGYCRYSTPGGTRSACAYTDSGYGDPLNWTGTISPTVTGSTNVPNVKLSMSGGSQPGPFKISGFITSSTLQTVEGVSVSASTGEADTTDASGYYEITLTSPWTGTITPVKAEWVFTPINKSYTNISTDQANQNFTGKYSYGGGTGTSEDPYLIYTAEQMNSIGNNTDDWNRYFMLMEDIDLGYYDGLDGRPVFNTIGLRTPSTTTSFTGVFNGNGHSISNFKYLTYKANGVGIFVALDGPQAEIKNLTIVTPDINNNGSGYQACLVARADGGTIRNCHVIGGTISGDDYVGALVGDNWGEIYDCTSSCNITGTEHIGGLTGRNQGSIYRSFASGNVTGTTLVGGLTGRNSNAFDSQGIINDCYASGSVSGTYAGGLVGQNWGGTISNCYSIGVVSGTSTVGGLIGGTVSNGLCNNSFWNTLTSEQTTSAGGVGKTTSEMKTMSTFINAGWDFIDETANGTNDIWKIVGSDYPRFAWEQIAPPSDITIQIDLDNVWMYQNLSGQTKSNITAQINEVNFNDPLSNNSYTFTWEIVLPGDVTVMPTTVSGGSSSDLMWQFAAPSCAQTASLSDSGQTFKVRFTITGDDFGNTGVAEKEFGIALLGDINNDGIVNVTDRSIANTFWRTGTAGKYTFKDCDLNCDRTINVTDRSIANSIWRGALGSNSVSVPCPLR